jgi:formate hydrogenlyase subunit 4
MVNVIIGIIAYIVLAPFVGGLLSGVDRIVSARLQGRFGPPLLQPFYDVLKLREKEDITVNNVQDFYVAAFFMFVIATGAIFFAGGDLLLVIFTLTTASVLLIMAAYSSNSPYAQVGAQRELLQMMAYEPMVLLTCVGFYMVNGSFEVRNIVTDANMDFLPLIGVFFGFLFILTIKLRKRPFDLSMSHHAHQELVKGLVTEFSGKTYALIEVAHWYENVFLLGMIFLFFANGTVWGAIIGVVVCIVVYFFEVLIDNSFARVKWQLMFKASWIVALVLGCINLFVLYLV